MTSPGGGSLGALFVDVKPGTSRFEPELASATTKAGQKAADQAGPGMGRRLAGHIGAAIAAGTGVLAVGLVKGLGAAVGQARDLNETVSRANTVFGKSGADIQKWARNAATDMGQSTKAAIDGATTFAIYGKAAGKAGSDLFNFSTDLTALASDMASFSNTSPEEAIEAIGAAMRGESDPIEKYGVLLNETVLKTRALKMGIIETTTQALTPQQRVLAVQAELFAQLGDKGSKTMGDFERTSKGLANQQRIAKAQVTDFAAEIGTSLLPVVTRVVTQFNTEWLPALRALWQQHGPAVVAWASTAATRFTAWASSIDRADVQGWLDRARGAFAAAQPVVAQFFQNFKEGGSQGMSDTIKVTGVVMRYMAENADLLGKALPYVAAALVAYKVAQLAANIAAVASPIATAAAALSNRRLAASNIELAAALRASGASTVANTVATTGNTAAENVSTLAKIRGTVATAAQRVGTIAATAATTAARFATLAFGAALRFAMGPIGIIITVVGVLTGAIIWLYKNNETARRIIDTAWKYIKVAIKATGDWIQFVLWPGIKKVYSGLETGVRFLVEVWRGQWNLAKTIISTVWGGIKGTFDTLNKFVTVTLPDGFRRGTGMIRSAWAQVKEAAAAPVRFVINTVFNGISGVFNRVAGFLNLPDSMRLPTLRAGFARGGRLPGPPSDVDNMLAMGPGGRAIALAGGEYVVNARQTAKHLPILKAINEGTEGYADGGLIGFIKNPIGWFKDKASGPIGRIRDMLGNTPMGAMLTGLATRFRDGAIDKAKSFLGGLFGGGGTGGPGNGTGMLRGLTAQMVVAARQVMASTGMNLTSGLRPGAITVTGNRSYHGAGRAGDFGPPSMRAFNIMARMFSYARELIYSPAGGRQIHNGRPHMYTGAVRRTHFDHIHLALANGGRVFDRGGLWPSGTVGVNTSGRTEVVTSGATMDDAVRLLAQLVALLGDLAPELAAALTGTFKTGRTLARAGAMTR